MRRIAVIVLLGCVATHAAAQDAVRLRNGRAIAGTVLWQESTEETLAVRMLDGAVIRLPRSALADGEFERLRAQPEPLLHEADLLDGILLDLGSRVVRGLLISEDDRSLHVKTAESETPMIVPRVAVRARREIRLPESSVYTPEERLARRERDADPSNPQDARRLAEFAITLGRALAARTPPEWERAGAMYARAAGHYRNAGDDAAARELEAKARLAEVFALASAARYEEALVAADRFVAEYGDTAAARNAGDLGAKLREEQARYLANRDAMMIPRIAEEWWRTRNRLLSECARRSLAEAMAQAQALDDQIFAALAARFRVTVEEVQRWWAARPQGRRQRASFGDGTWIVRGGQDGGTDVLEVLDDTGGTGMNPFDDLGGRFGFDPNQFPQGRGRSQRRPFDRNLQTSSEWWESQSSSERREWLDAYHAENSANIRHQEVFERACRYCRGSGALETTRSQTRLRVACPRCHNMAANHDGRVFDVAIEYW